LIVKVQRGRLGNWVLLEQVDYRYLPCWM